MSATDDLFRLKLDHGEKFTPDEVTLDLRTLAEFWLINVYEGDFEYLVDMKATARKRTLSDGMIKGVLNCMLAQMREPLEPGMYLKDETIYKVQCARTGAKRPYAKRLVIHEACGDHKAHEPYEWSPCLNCGTLEGESSVEFEYAPDAIKTLAPMYRMTLEEAKALGALYGTCIVCGRTLSDEKSVAAGIGPTCAKKV